MRRISSIPMKISSKPATVWKMSMAISSPNQYPMEMIVVMRIMFRISNVMKPSAKRLIFFRKEAEATNVRKVANMVKAIRVYIPEHAKSIENDNGSPAEVVSTIIGDPKDEDKLTGKPMVFSKVNDACVLKLPIVPPTSYMNRVGGGTKKKRNKIGKINTNSIFRLNRINVTPMMKMGIDKR